MHILVICQHIHCNNYSKNAPCFLYLLISSLYLCFSDDHISSFLKKIKFDLCILPILCRKIGVIALIFSNLLHFKTTHIMIFFFCAEGTCFKNVPFQNNSKIRPLVISSLGIFNLVTFVPKYIWPIVSESLHNECVSHNKHMVKLLPLKDENTQDNAVMKQQK